VAVLPIGLEQDAPARAFEAACLRADLRVERWSEGSLANRVREASQRKIPYVAVIGAREAAGGEVSLGKQVLPVREALAEIEKGCRQPEICP
jgi:threonyl-tRNA synthetase